MRSIRWRLVFMYLTLVFIVMLISGTFIIKRMEVQEMKSAEYELKSCAIYIEEQIIQQYDNPEDFQNGFVDLFIRRTNFRNVHGSILNVDGETIASTLTNEPSNSLDYKNSVVISAISGNESFSSFKRTFYGNYSSEKMLSYGYPVFEEDGTTLQYVVYVQMNAENIVNILSQTTKTIVFSVVLALAASAVLGMLFANTITGPISMLTKKANLLAKGQLEQHIIVKSNDEIGQLTRSFNYMARELRKTVSEMENENNKLEILLQNMTDGMVAFDEMGMVIHANKICCDLLEVDYYRITLEWFLNKIDVQRSALQPNQILEVPFATDDKYINVSIVAYTGKSSRVEGIVAVLHDITKHRRLDDMRKEFVANVSHEIRTPITNIKSYTETLIEGDIDDEEIVKDFLNEINMAADRVKFLTNDLLELSKLDDNKIKFKFMSENLYELVYYCIKQNNIIAQQKEQNIILREPETKELAVYVDKERVNQVINNIISNALKYSPEKTNVIVSFEILEEQYHVKIQDNGIGIPKEDLDRVFERFYRVDKARSRMMGGNGLGLSIAKEMMKSHGGTILAKSTVGKGSLMTIVFPKEVIAKSMLENTKNI